MQTTLLSLAIAVIVALVAALLGPYFIDWNAHRAAFEQQASQAIGLPVRVSGALDVRLLPSPSLVMSGVEVGRPGDPQALRAKALGIEFALPPLFSGKLRAVEMRLIGPEVRLSLESDGRAVFPNALVAVNVEALSIEKLTIEDARLEFFDTASGTRATASKLWFNGEVRALPGPIRGEGAFVMDGALYGYRIATARPEGNGSRVKVTFEPSDRPVVAEADGFITLDGGMPRFEGQTTIARRMASKSDETVDPWRITARVKANPAAALLEQVEFQYGPEDRALKLSGTAEATFGADPRLDVVLSARQLDADKLLATGGGAALTPRAAIAALMSAAGGIAQPPIPTQLGFGIDSVMLGGSHLQNVRGDIEMGRGLTHLSGFEARAPGITQVQASGQIDTSAEQLSFKGPIDVTSVDPRIFAEWFEGKASILLPDRPLRLRGDVTWSAAKVAIERLQAEIDRKTLDGSVVYVRASAGQRSRLDLRLRADELDLDALVPLADSTTTIANFERPDDVSLALVLERLRFAGVDAGKADLRLALTGDGLTVERLAVGAAAGLSFESKGRIDLQTQTPRGALTFNLAMRDPAAVASLAARVAPGWAAALQRSATVAAPTKLQGTISVEPAGKLGASRTTLVVSGALGAIQLNVKTLLTGKWLDVGRSDIALDASLDATDVNAVVTLAGAERLVSVPRQPGTYTLSLHGRSDSDLRLDTRIVSANLDARASGSIRPFAADGNSGALDLAIGKAELVFQRQPLPVTLRASLKTDALGARLDNLSATIAGHRLRGNLGLAFGEIPAINGELKADLIDVGAAFAAATGLDAASSKKSSGERNWSEAPFSLAAMPAFAGALKLEAARAVLSPSFTASNLRTTLRLTPMQVAAEAVEADLAGGQGSANVTLRRGVDGIGIQGRLVVKDAEAAQLLFASYSPAPLAGRATLDVQFEGAGLSPKALIGSLNGSGTLTLDKARFAALDPKAFTTAMRSVDQGLPLDATRIRDVVGRALEAGPLTVESADASLTIAAGVVRVETFTARTDTADIAVTGSFHLADSRIDARVALSGQAPAGVSLRPELGVMLRGPASALERSLDVSALTGWLALRSVDRQAKQIEAIEQGRPDLSPPVLEEEPVTARPEASPSPPRRRRPAPPQQPAAEALPAPVEIRPAAGDRRRNPQRVEGAPQRPLDIRPNPFPQPIAPQNSQPIFR